MHRKSVYFLLAAVGLLIVIGCVMLFSTSAFALDHRGDPNYFIKRQFVWLAIGLAGLIVATNVDYHFWGKRWKWWFGASLVLLALCFAPGIGLRINGSSRWLDLGVSSFQPSEFAKVATICALAAWYSRKDVEATSFMRGFVMPAGIAALPLMLILPEVDMGATALIGATVLAIMFLAGVRMSIIAPVIIASLAAGYYAATHMQQRLWRLLAFLDLEKYKLGVGLQQYQALIAFGSGGIDGLGLGNSRQKLAYLPEAHTDFIFSIIGEELGVRFTLLIVACYLVMILCGVLIAMNSRDRFGMLLGFGLVMVIALQAAVNIGVNTALLPNKGLPLPFVSYGGSNLAFCLLSIGILINIYRQGLTVKEVARKTVLAARTGARRPGVRI
ncbi:MAG: putative lipid II flippase FtsW [Chthoniobacteraceae bacterium]